MLLPLIAVSLLANMLGIASFFVFTVSVFRPTALWAHALAGAAIACMAMAGVGSSAALAMAPGTAHSFAVTWGWAGHLQRDVRRSASSGWASKGCTSGGCRGGASRSGSCDPVVSNRLLMWGVFGISTTLLCLVLLAVLLSGHPTATSLVAQLAQALFGIVSSGAATLAFSPPPAFLARLRGRLEPRSSPDWARPLHRTACLQSAVIQV